MFDCNVLVTGASGLLGRQVISVLTSDSIKCHGLCYSRPSEDLTSLDLTDLSTTRQFLMDLKPSHVIHAAAQRFPDKVEADLEAARKLNIDSTRNLAEVCKEIGARMIYISTDYVFDGNHPPYFPDNKTNPLNKYGQTKLEGEQAVLQVDPNFLVLRIPVLYGGVKTLNESAVTILLDVVRKGESAKVSSYEVRCPSHTRDIARIISQEFGLNMDHLQEVTGAGGTPRPRDVELDRSSLKQLGIEYHTDFKEGLIQDLKLFI